LFIFNWILFFLLIPIFLFIFYLYQISSVFIQNLYGWNSLFIQLFYYFFNKRLGPLCLRIMAALVVFTELHKLSYAAISWHFGTNQIKHLMFCAISYIDSSAFQGSCVTNTHTNSLFLSIIDTFFIHQLVGWFGVNTSSLCN